MTERERDRSHLEGERKTLITERQTCLTSNRNPSEGEMEKHMTEKD